ncbi:MAG: hypothetical protein ACYDH9_23760 [Limisphaerales bacterium]
MKSIYPNNGKVETPQAFDDNTTTRSQSGNDNLMENFRQRARCPLYASSEWLEVIAQVECQLAAEKCRRRPDAVITESWWSWQLAARVAAFLVATVITLWLGGCAINTIHRLAGRQAPMISSAIDD